MLYLMWLLLLALAWGLWNLYQKLHRLDALIAQWQETLAAVRGLDEPGAAVAAPGPDQNHIRVTVEISNALEVAKRYHWAGGAGAMAPAVLKKVMQDRIYERIGQSLREGGHDADLRVIVL